MTLWRKESMDGIFGASEAPEKCPHCNSSWDNGERLHTGDDAGIGGYEDLMCFPVRVSDLEPTSCSTYDPWALSDPDPEPVETLSISEWNLRCIAREDAEREKIRRERRERYLRADS